MDRISQCAYLSSKSDTSQTPPTPTLTAHYDQPIRRFLDELFALGDVFKDNRAGQVLQQDVSSLVHTLVYDEQGQPKVKLELVKDIEVLLSAFLRKVRTASVGCVWANLRCMLTQPNHSKRCTRRCNSSPSRASPSPRRTSILSRMRSCSTCARSRRSKFTSRRSRACATWSSSAVRERDADSLTNTSRKDHPDLPLQSNQSQTTNTQTAGYSYREAQEQREREQEKAWEEQPTTAVVQEKQTRHGVEPIELSTFVRIHLKEIHSDLRDIKFYYDKKVGLMENGRTARSDSHPTRSIHPPLLPNNRRA